MERGASKTCLFLTHLNFEIGTITHMVQLTAEQSAELSREESPRVVANGEEFVLIRTEVFERIKGLIEEPEEIDQSLYEFDEVENP